MSTVALADLEHAKSDYATRTLRSLLSLPVVRNTFASVFDGFPTRNTRLKDNLDLAQGVEEQSEPSESALSRYAQLVDKLRPETLRIHANVAQAFQNAAFLSADFNRRLLETVAFIFHDLAIQIYNDAHTAIIPHRKSPHDPKDTHPALYHPNYQSHHLHPNGTLEAVGYWAEAQVFGGVVVFERGLSGSECRQAFIHPPWKPHFQLSDRQVQRFADLGEQSAKKTIDYYPLVVPFEAEPDARLLYGNESLDLGVFRVRDERARLSETARHPPRVHPAQAELMRAAMEEIERPDQERAEELEREAIEKTKLLENLVPSNSAAVSKLLKVFRLLTEGRYGTEEYPSWLNIPLSQNEFVSLWKTLKRDESVMRFAMYDLRYDFDPDSQVFIVRKSTPVEESFMSKVTGEIENQLVAFYKDNAHHEALGKFLNRLVLHQSPLAFNDYTGVQDLSPEDRSAYVQWSPDAAIRLHGRKYPYIVLEACSIEKVRDMPQVAANYLRASLNTVGILMSFDIEQAKTKEARLRIWRGNTLQHRSDIIEVSRSLAEVFRAPDGTSRSGDLSLHLRDLAQITGAEVDVDVDVLPFAGTRCIRISYQRLTELLQNAEAESGIQTRGNKTRKQAQDKDEPAVKRKREPSPSPSPSPPPGKRFLMGRVRKFGKTRHPGFSGTLSTSTTDEPSEPGNDIPVKPVGFTGVSRTA